MLYRAIDNYTFRPCVLMFWWKECKQKPAQTQKGLECTFNGEQSGSTGSPLSMRTCCLEGFNDFDIQNLIPPFLLKTVPPVLMRTAPVSLLISRRAVSAVWMSAGHPLARQRYTTTTPNHTRTAKTPMDEERCRQILQRQKRASTGCPKKLDSVS